MLITLFGFDAVIIHTHWALLSYWMGKLGDVKVPDGPWRLLPQVFTVKKKRIKEHNDIVIGGNCRFSWDISKKQLHSESPHFNAVTITFLIKPFSWRLVWVSQKKKKKGNFHHLRVKAEVRWQTIKDDINAIESWIKWVYNILCLGREKRKLTDIGRRTERGTEGHIDVIDTVSSNSLDNIT